MAIFSKKDKKPAEKPAKAEAKKVQKKEPSKPIVVSNNSNFSILIRPRITEKASDVTAGNVYVFNVSPRANKKDIGRAFTEQFKVKPIKIRTMPIPKKSKFVRGRKGVSGGGKKAYVYLKKGDTIEII